MQKYKYELHSHTSQSSICSSISGAALVCLYKKLGCEAICVTDHFFNGNTTVPINISWKKQVDLLFSGYEDALNEGKKIGIKVFFGWEYSFNGTDYLTYGLDKNWLMKNRNCLNLTVKDYCSLVKNDGGYIVHAHPFREADYIDMIRLNPGDVDAVETYNANRTAQENERALWYSDDYNLTSLCGSDIHSKYQKNIGLMTSTICHNDIHSLIDDMKSGNMQIEHMNLEKEIFS